MPYDPFQIERQRGQATADDARARGTLVRLRGRVEAVEADAAGGRVTLALGGDRRLVLPVSAAEAGRFRVGDEVELEVVPGLPA